MLKNDEGLQVNIFGSQQIESQRPVRVLGTEEARESGLSERPHRCRTWSPKGQTPVLQYHFNWNSLSAIAGVTRWNFYFRLFPGTIGGSQVVEFLQHLLRQRPGKLLVIWDGLTAHRSQLVKDFVAEHRKRLEVERLPAYAPELNPVEYL